VKFKLKFPKGSDFFSGYKNSPCFYFSQEKRPKQRWLKKIRALSD